MKTTPCPSCGEQVQHPEEFSGTLECPHCQNLFKFQTVAPPSLEHFLARERRRPPEKPKWVCRNCESLLDTPGVEVIHGSMGVEICLWLFFLLPGLIYSIWRSSNSARHMECPHCRSREIIPASSAAAQRILMSRT